VGILGIATTQALLSGVGLMFTDIPAVGVWVLLVLIVAIIQLPPILILGPLSAYYFSIADTTPAIIFLVWNILVSSSDAVLKPLFLGRGMDTPMLVILLGAIGGMMLSGIIGLFTRAIILALGYQLMIDWLAVSTSNENSSIEEK
jgi:predicted PurR-regulated permease PerM